MKIITLLLLLVGLYTQAQEMPKHISKDLMEPITYRFTLNNDKLSGEGGAHLLKVLEDAQFTLLGEYHGSYRISEFTNALIPELNAFGYSRMGLEVGPITGQYLNSLDSNIHAQIKANHKKYMQIDPEDADDKSVSFPFFDANIDIDFLEKAKVNNWEIIGVDQEYFYGFVALADHMYAYLPKDNKREHKKLYNQVVDALNLFYKNDFAGTKDFTVAVKESGLINNFLKQMASVCGNQDRVAAFNKSIEIYNLYDSRQWFENNATRIKHMKNNLRKGLETIGFDISKDKLLMKMGGYHLAKGFSPLGLFEVGNTLNELAEFYGNYAINIGFETRFYENEDGIVEDNLASKNQFIKNRKSIIQMGDQHQWTLIDLRPIIKGHYYGPVTFKFENRALEELVERYDFLIIPPTDKDSVPVY